MRDSLTQSTLHTVTGSGCSDYIFTYVEDYKQGFSLSKLQVLLILPMTNPRALMWLIYTIEYVSPKFSCFFVLHFNTVSGY